MRLLGVRKLAMGVVACLGSVVSFGMPSSAGSPPAIAARLSATKITVGATAYAQGKMAPPTATGRVVLQRKVNGRWSDRDSALVDRSSGGFSIKLRPSSAGVYTMRVRSNGGSVVSNTFYLKVSAPAPKYTATITPYTNGISRLVDFSVRHTQEVVILDLAFNTDPGGDGFSMEPDWEPNIALGFVCATHDADLGWCIDGAEILITDLKSVPDASLWFEHGQWRLRGRFAVRGVSGPHMGILSLSLRAVPIA